MYIVCVQSLFSLVDHCWHLWLCLFCWVKTCFLGMIVPAPLWPHSCSTMWPHPFITCGRRKSCFRCVNYCCLLLLISHLGQVSFVYQVVLVLFYMLHVAEWNVVFMPAVYTVDGATVRCCSCNHTCCSLISASLSLFGFTRILYKELLSQKKIACFSGADLWWHFIVWIDSFVELLSKLFGTHCFLAGTTGFALLFVVTNCTRKNDCKGITTAQQFRRVLMFVRVSQEESRSWRMFSCVCETSKRWLTSA